jgi:hypothetical protein
MILMKIVIMLICGALFFWGGYSWHNARRFIMPLVLAIFCAIYTQCWLELTMFFSAIFLSLGYGINSPLRHIFGNGWGRGVWGILVGLALSLSLLLTGHLAWYFFLGYLTLSFTLENALKNLPQSLGDPIIGCGFATIVFLIS